MTRPTLLLVHGWAFDPHFWTPLRDHLPDWDAISVDLGFFGPASTPPCPEGRSVIAVGHSYGLAWLLANRPTGWSRLVAINGFTRFTRGPDFGAGVDSRLPRRMAAGLREDPAAVVADFRLRCGLATPPPTTLDATILQQELDALTRCDHRGASLDLALCGETDPIVSTALSRACFTDRVTSWHKGGHLLPLAEPAWCAGQLRALWERTA